MENSYWDTDEVRVWGLVGIGVMESVSQFLPLSRLILANTANGVASVLDSIKCLLRKSNLQNFFSMRE